MPTRRDKAVRIPVELVDRADALLEAGQSRRDLFGWHTPSRASIIAAALDRGLILLAAELEEGGRDGEE